MTTDPSGDDLGVEPRSGVPTEAKVFFGIAAFLLFLGVVYAATTGYAGDIEFAGTLALVGGSAFAGFFAAYLLRTVRRVQDDFEALEEAHAAGDASVDDVLYLPSQSPWPLGLGVGLSLVLAGVPLGVWVLLPGIALFAYSLIGFAHQSRSRG
jgi:hypothetical protein